MKGSTDKKDIESEVVTQRNSRIFNERSPFRDPDNPLYLVGIGKNLNGDANAVYDSPEEFIWSFLNPDQKFAKDKWNSFLREHIPELLQMLSSEEKLDMYRYYVFTAIDSKEWFREAEIVFDEEVAGLRAYAEKLNVYPWVDEALNYAQTHFKKQKDSIVRDIAEHGEEDALSSFQKLSDQQQCTMLTWNCEDNSKMMNHATNLLIAELGEKYLITPFYLGLPDYLPVGCDGELPEYEYLEKYSGLIVADKDTFAKKYFDADKWNEDEHIDRALDIIFAAFDDFDHYHQEKTTQNEIFCNILQPL